MKFYEIWFHFEDKFEQWLKILKFLSLNSSSFKTIDELIESVQMMLYLNYDQIKDILQCEDVYHLLKTNFAIELINEKLEETKIDRKYLQRVAQDLSTHLIYFIEKFIFSLTSINNLTSFEFCIIFCIENRIKTSDLFFIKNVTASDLKQ